MPRGSRRAPRASRRAAAGAGPSRTSHRVLLVTAALTNGGLERQLVLLARSLPSSWKSAVWTVDGGPFESICRTAGIPCRVAGRRARADVFPALELWCLLRHLRPDVVHSWHWMTTAAALPACRVLGIPLVDGSIRRGDLPDEGWRPHALLPRHADVVVANSRAGLQAYGIPPAKGRVVYNGFEPARLRQLRTVVPNEDFTVVMSARMTADKDYATVIRAARIVVAVDTACGRPASPRPWQFVFVGSGPAREELEIMADELVAAGVIRFVDGGLEPLGEVARARVGVLMTDPARLAEGCSNAIMEYMACGLPVVCADSGGNRELVLDETTGFVVTHGDEAALADRLLRLRDDDDLAFRLGQAGRARIQECFSLDRMVRSWVSVYEELVVEDAWQRT